MTGTLLLDLQSRRTQADLVTVREWEEAAIQVARLEDELKERGDGVVESAMEAINTVARYPDEIRDAWARLRGPLREGKVHDYQALGLLLKNLIHSSLEVVSSAEGLVRLARDSFGRTVEGAGSLRETADQIRGLEKQLLGAWPWVDADKLTRMIEGSEQARTRPAREVFDELRRRLY